jgi:hypothetical protein
VSASVGALTAAIVAIFLTVSCAQAASPRLNLRVLPPPATIIQPKSGATSTTGASSSACAPSNQLGDECVSNPFFSTYLGAAQQCNGHILTLAELYAFKTAHPDIKGIECSADWNAAVGVIYCVDENGYVSGSGIQNQAEGLGKNPHEFRCLIQ